MDLLIIQLQLNSDDTMEKVEEIIDKYGYTGYLDIDDVYQMVIGRNVNK